MSFNNYLRMPSQAFLACALSVICTYIFLSISHNIASMLDIALDIYFLISIYISFFIYKKTSYKSFGLTLFMMSFLSASFIRFF